MVPGFRRGEPPQIAVTAITEIVDPDEGTKWGGGKKRDFGANEKDRDIGSDLEYQTESQGREGKGGRRR